MATKSKPAAKPIAVRKQAPLPATAAPMGRGFEEADADAFAIPFLVVLQKSTPWADPDDPAYIKGAKAGMFINTVTLELYDQVEIIPCVYQRRFNRWAPRDAGGGFKGTFQKSQVDSMEAAGTIGSSEEGRMYFVLPDGTVNEKKCDILTDTRMHYCLQVLENGSVTQVLVSLSRTQLKKSRSWMMLMQTRGGDMWSTVYLCNTKLEENDKGKWMGWVITASRESEPEERAAAEAFYASVQSGSVKVKMDAVKDN